MERAVNGAEKGFAVTSSFTDKIGIVIHLCFENDMFYNKALVSIGLIERCKKRTTPTPLEFTARGSVVEWLGLWVCMWLLRVQILF